jgi:hypothetical protein
MSVQAFDLILTIEIRFCHVSHIGEANWKMENWSIRELEVI